MKKFISTLAISSFLATTATAGGLAEPLVEPEVIMEPEVIAEETASSGNFLVPLLILAAIVAIASGSSGGGSGPVSAPPLKK